MKASARRPSPGDQNEESAAEPNDESVAEPNDKSSTDPNDKVASGSNDQSIDTATDDSSGAEKDEDKRLHNDSCDGSSIGDNAAVSSTTEPDLGKIDISVLKKDEKASSSSLLLARREFSASLSPITDGAGTPQPDPDCGVSNDAMWVYGDDGNVQMIAEKARPDDNSRSGVAGVGRSLFYKAPSTSSPHQKMKICFATRERLMSELTSARYINAKLFKHLVKGKGKIPQPLLELWEAFFYSMDDYFESSGEFLACAMDLLDNPATHRSFSVDESPTPLVDSLSSPTGPRHHPQTEPIPGYRASALLAACLAPTQRMRETTS